MALVLYNSLSRQKEVFSPFHDDVVGMYVCGPTVYGPPHLGHARSSVTFDILNRYLQHKGFRVRFIRNYTDVGHLEHDSDDGDDKIEKQALKEDILPYEISQKYINLYRHDMSLLNCLTPSIEPQATAFIQEQISLTQQIIDKGFAYVVNGSVYFDVCKYDDKYGAYGILSGRKIDSLYSSTRDLKSQGEKKNSYDFALWKKADSKHIMRWQSPWSVGFPGWHTECVAMSGKFLGERFDIHGGGIDLQFPHHEAEIAQAQVAYGTSLANIWMHNNFVNINDQKMSKSLNNYITLDDLFFNKNNILGSNYDSMALRFLFLQTHYRSTLSISRDALDSAQKGYTKLINALLSVKQLHNDSVDTKNIDLEKKIGSLFDQCYVALDDDLNTPQAIAHLFDIVSIINDFESHKIDINDISTESLNKMKVCFKDVICNILGFNDANIDDSLKLIMELYIQAKDRKDFSQVDFIRKEIDKQNLKMCDYNGYSVLKNQ